MQPDRPNNYWTQDSEPDGSDKITEMYDPNTSVQNEVSTKDQPTQPLIQSEETSPTVNNNPVHWSATEYIEEGKNWLWFVVFAIVAALFIGFDVLFLHSYTFSALVVVMAVSVLVFAHRPPRDIDYTLSGDQGLYIGEKLYHFTEFKAFGLIKDRGQHSIILIPVKRFSLGVSVYFPEEVGEEIIDILGARLPMENLKLDFVDIIAQKLRL